MQLNYSRQAGATLIEIIMVVALMAIITIGALTYYNSASEASKVQETISNLSALSSMIRNQFATQNDYNGITESLVASSANVPPSMKSTTAGHLRHPWSQSNNAVQISTAAPYSTFNIQLTEIPQGACVDIVSKTFKSFEGVTIGGHTLNKSTTDAVVQITSGCAAATTTITFNQR